jgi:hypothetical protein
MENVMSSPESRLKPDREIQLSDAAGVAQPAGSESKQERNTTTPSQAESVLAAEKRTLEMMANGASLAEVLNDLCASIDAHSPPFTSMVCLMDGEWLSPRAGPHVPATFKAAITPWRIGPDRASCGAAAFTKQRVIVPNISKDPRWPDDARDLTLSHGFSAAWSEPLISKDGEVRAAVSAVPKIERRSRVEPRYISERLCGIWQDAHCIGSIRAQIGSAKIRLAALKSFLLNRIGDNAAHAS